MKPKRTVTFVASALAITLLAASVVARQKTEALWGKQSALEEVLYVPSGRALKRMSLGYSGLLANIYWTRAVQYFGEHYQVHSTRYDLLAPLLDITTDLDPHLIVAYQTGSIFLSQIGALDAGQHQKAVALLEKGIRENPDVWQLYFTLGFVHYIDRRDYKAAQEAFEAGSKVPGARDYMTVMAARMAANRGDIATAIAMWKGIYDANTDPNIRHLANKHLQSLQAEADMQELDRRIQVYREKTGTLPRHWLDLVHAGLLRGVPQDPTGTPYKLMADGTAQVEDPSQFLFLREGRDEQW